MKSPSLLKRNALVLKHFMQRDLLVLRNIYKGLLINSAIWPALTALVFGYIMPTLGLGADYGGFAVIGAVVAVSFYTSFQEMFFLVQDFEEARAIDFELCLPTTPQLLITKFASIFTFRCLVRTLPLPFIGKLLLYHRFSFEHFSVLKFLIASFLLNFAFSLFMLLCGSMLRVQSLGDFRVRVVDQLFFLGCFFFSWQTLHQLIPVAAYINLLNPVTYAMEASRVSFLGQHEFLSFWVCCGALVAFCGLFFWLTTIFLRRRLDYVVLKG